MEKLLDISELSDVLGIAQNTIYKWTSKSEIPYFKLGKHLRFKESEVSHWLESHRFR